MKKQSILAAFCLQTALALAQTTDDQLYSDALALARSGHAEQALPKLKQLVQSHPDIQRYRFDYLVCLAWADRNAELIEQSAGINAQDAPVYLLEAMAKAAKNLGDFKKAESLYRIAQAKAPERLVPKLGLALLHIDQGRTASAVADLQALSVAYPENTEIILAQAYAHEMANQYAIACKYYQKILDIKPGDEEARRGLILALASSGAVQQDMDMAEANKALFSDEQRAKLRWDYAAWLIRQGEQALQTKPRDYLGIDKAITALNANIGLTDKLRLNDRTGWLARAKFDLLLALRDRKRMREAIAVYRQLHQQGLAIPAYARMAAADAFLNNREPETARDLYLSVIKEAPDYFNARASLVYAYLEAEQIGKALALAEQLAREQPEKLEFKEADGSVSRRDNPQKISADLTAAILHAYADDLKEAQKRLEKLQGQHPDNTDIHSKLAELYYFRGWPRQAGKHIDSALTEAPEHWGLKLNQAKVRRELKDYRSEEQITHTLNESYPEDSGVQKQMRAWRIHNDRELRVFANGGITENSTNGASNPAPLISNDEISIDTLLYSEPIGHNFRVFTHNGWKMASFKEGNIFELNPTNGNWQAKSPIEGRGYLTHYGLGLEYAQDNITSTIEVHYDNAKFDTVGVDLGIDYQFDDYWQIYTRLSSRDNNIPVRALKHGVTAKSAQLGFNYRVNESRQFNLNTRYYNFSSGNSQVCNSLITPATQLTLNGNTTTIPPLNLSSKEVCNLISFLGANVINLTNPPFPSDVSRDSNNRYVIDTTYYERWISTPIYKFSTYLNAGFSANTSNNVFYYSPKKDASLSLTLDNDVLTYRHYETAFHQRLALSIGNYWQQDFGSNIVGNIQYEHRWQLASRFELIYGGVRRYQYYDDARTETWYMYLTADLRF